MNDKNENIDFFDIETLTNKESDGTSAENNPETTSYEPSNWQEILKDMQGEPQDVEHKSEVETKREPSVVEDKAVTSALEQAFSPEIDKYEIKPMKKVSSSKGALILLLILVLLVGGVCALQFAEIIDLPFLEFINNLKNS